MSDGVYKWMLGLALLGMVADTLASHPALEAKDEYQYRSLIPQHRVHGFASERQWLFAHRKFRNQCVLEALAADERQSKERVESASVLFSDRTSSVVRVTNNY